MLCNTAPWCLWPSTCGHARRSRDWVKNFALSAIVKFLAELPAELILWKLRFKKTFSRRKMDRFHYRPALIKGFVLLGNVSSFLLLTSFLTGSVTTVTLIKVSRLAQRQRVKRSARANIGCFSRQHPNVSFRFCLHHIIRAFLNSSQQVNKRLVRMLTAQLCTSVDPPDFASNAASF